MLLREKAGLLEHSLGDTIFIKEGHQQVKIHIQMILYTLKALKDYTQIITGSKILEASSLGNI